MIAPATKILARICVLAALSLTPSFGQSCVNFPAGFVLFSSISYVTAADSAGDHLVVGVPSPGAVNMISSSIPLPASANQMFCDAQVQLAPQQFYPNVYVPTAAEQAGNFSAFSGLLVNASGQPFPNGIIPLSLQGSVFAWRIGPAQPSSALRGWSPTGSAPIALFRTPAVLLPSGKVFIPATTATTSLSYDPSTGAFSNLAAPLYTHGNYVRAVLLGNGLVLVAGGQTAPMSAELYDPVADKFTSLPPMLQGHGTNFTVTVLQSGRVLIDGGSTTGVINSTTTYAGAELFDPVANTFSAAGAVVTPREYHTATLLPDGRVLIAAGSTNVAIFNSAEIYNPTSNTFTATGALGVARFGANAVLLPDGKVLIVGGYYTASAEVFDPVAGTFSPTATANDPHADGGAVLLSSGQALIFGGGGTAIAETYSQSAGVFTLASLMSTARYSFSYALLQDGRVFVAGGGTSAGAAASAEIYTPVTQGLVTSQTGTTFRAPSGSTTAASQTIAVISNTASIPWTVSTHTYQGGNWLTVAPNAGNSIPGAPPVTLSITANPFSLAAQDYYGAVTLTPTDGLHPPVSISIVLSIVPPGTAAPPAVTPSALIFLATPGAVLNPQTFTISNLTSSPIAFSGLSSATPNWFSFIPASQTLNAAQSASVSILPSISTLSTGVYPGSVKLTFSDGSTQTVDLLLVISATPPSAAPESPATHVTAAALPACAATKLLPVFTTLGTGFNTPAAWPTPIVVQVVDDCGNAFRNGSVIVSFSDGDPPINLLSTGNGNWAGTWVPVRSSAGFTARADAQQLPLTGTVQVSGQVFSNPSVPLVSPGGVVSAGDFTSSPALGLLVSIFGSGLADGVLGDSGVPLPPQLGSTSVTLSGRTLPLLYVSANQVNVAIPYDVQVDSAQQLVVLRGNAVSVPVPLAVYDDEPAILSVPGNGSGQGLIFNAVTGVLADMNAPATAGDVLVIYTVGLGAVNPTITIEDGAPLSPLSRTVAPVTVTIGGVPAPVAFSGLTPEYVGLYQVNLVVPSGIAPGSQVPVTLSVAGKSLQGNVYMAIQ
jgi:uncharacterized protein (TIGR03437 family)